MRLKTNINCSSLFINVKKAFDSLRTMPSALRKNMTPRIK